MKTLKDIIAEARERNVTEAADDKKEYDYEGEMVKNDLHVIVMHCEKLASMLEDNTNLPEWVQGKITLAKDYMQTVSDYMCAEMHAEDFKGEKSAVINAIRTLNKKSRHPGYTDAEREEFRKSKEVEKQRLKQHYQQEEVQNPTSSEVKSKCWKGYTAVGMKKKKGKWVPNCVPE